MFPEVSTSTCRRSIVGANELGSGACASSTKRSIRHAPAPRARELDPLDPVVEDDRPVDDDEVPAVVVAPRLHAAHFLGAQAELQRELLACLIVDEAPR